jgi:Protein of unknown function (DUF4254)
MSGQINTGSSSSSMSPMKPVALESVSSFHDEMLRSTSWPPKQELPEFKNRTDVWRWIAENHRNNCLLWDEEDLARRTQVSDSEIALNKRHIDGFNQARNDATERVDEFLLIALGLVGAEAAGTSSPVSQAKAGARLNSETAGSMIDRMSIMALKIKAMTWQLQRKDVDAAFVAATQTKLDRLIEQRHDLGTCLDRLLADTQAGLAYFKVYRQFKMYNDASMNPALLAERRAG